MRLNEIQKELKAPKNQNNTFWKYKYRSCEDILEAVKPLLKEAILTISDEVVLVWDRIYVKATATYTELDKSISTTAFAREPLSQKGMNEAQITWSASSYARKYALNGLFCIDDTKDADATNDHKDDKLEESRKALKQESKKIWFNYDNFMEAIQAWNKTEDDFKKLIQEDWFTLWWPAKKALRTFVETWEIIKY